jgi:hypothetical protein
MVRASSLFSRIFDPDERALISSPVGRGLVYIRVVNCSFNVSGGSGPEQPILAELRNRRFRELC